MNITEDTREDTITMLELERLNAEHFDGIKAPYMYRYNGKKMYTGCARCAEAMDDSAVYGEHERGSSDHE
jgi:hypothetical protein